MPWTLNGSILEKDDEFRGGFERKALNSRGADVGKGQVSVRHKRSVEVPIAHEGRVLPHESLVEDGLVEEALSIGCWKMVLVVGTAIDAGSGVQGCCNSFLTSLGVIVWQEDVLHGVTVGSDPLQLLGPGPVLTEDSL